jgi:hypothetical protein
MMSTTDPAFLGTMESWLRSRPEILVLIRYSRAVGSKEFQFFFSYHSLSRRLIQLPPSTSVIAFREPQLPLRGLVDAEFIRTCLSAIPENSEFLLLENSRQQGGETPSTHWVAGEIHAELRNALEELMDRPVAVGPYPPWLAATADVIDAVVPDEDGLVRPGIY